MDIEPLDIIPDTNYKVLVTHPDPVNFAVQFETSLPTVENIQHVCEEHGVDSPKLSLDQVRTIGTICIAQYTDAVWYRACVRDFDETSDLVTIYFIDYGNVHVVPWEESIRKCPDDIAEIPPQAIVFQWKYANPGSEEGSLFLERLLEFSEDEIMVNCKVADIKSKSAATVCNNGEDGRLVIVSIPILEESVQMKRLLKMQQLMELERQREHQERAEAEHVEGQRAAAARLDAQPAEAVRLEAQPAEAGQVNTPPVTVEETNNESILGKLFAENNRRDEIMVWLVGKVMDAEKRADVCLKQLRADINQFENMIKLQEMEFREEFGVIVRPN